MTIRHLPERLDDEHFGLSDVKERVLEYLGLSVNRLIRVSFGPFQLQDLEEGAVEETPVAKKRK